jgi:hypothetical protein
MNGAPESQTAASTSPLVGPYPIDEDALRRLKRLHDDGAIDAHEFKRRKAEALGLREGSLAWACLKGGDPAPTPRQTFPVRPELFKFTDPRAVCQLNRTSKTLQIDLQGTKAWARLAEAQLPPPTPRDDNEARSHVMRRELAKASPSTRRVLEGVTLLEAVSRQAPAPVAFTPNELSDFTFFLRLTNGERLIWEGDLGELSRPPWASDGDGIVGQLSLRHADLGWMDRADVDDLEPLTIALVAIRDHDQAMVSLGLYDFHEYGSDLRGLLTGHIRVEKRYHFSPRSALFSSARSGLELWPFLSPTQDAHVHRLELQLWQFTREPRSSGGDGPQDYGDGPRGCDESRFQHVLSYLAGINSLARASALAKIESWFVSAERRAGWLRVELRAALAAPLAALAARFEEVEKDIAQAEKDGDIYLKLPELDHVAGVLKRVKRGLRKAPEADKPLAALATHITETIPLGISKALMVKDYKTVEALDQARDRLRALQ